MLKKTKICATIGPSCEDTKTLIEMVKAGMNIARLNFSHGSYENHAQLIKNLREVERKTSEPIAIMQDLQGPKIRVGDLPEEGFKIKEGAKVVLTTSAKHSEDEVPLDYPDLHKYIEKGQRILIDDGHIELKVVDVSGDRITGLVVEGAVINKHKGLNLPDSKLLIPALGDKDKSDLKFGVEAGVDLVAMSFVRNAKDIIDLRFLIKQFEQELNLKNQQPIKIIAKIERHEAVENLKEAVELYFEDEGIKRENLPYIVNLKLQQVKTRLNLANA